MLMRGCSIRSVANDTCYTPVISLPGTFYAVDFSTWLLFVQWPRLLPLSCSIKTISISRIRTCARSCFSPPDLSARCFWQKRVLHPKRGRRYMDQRLYYQRSECGHYLLHRECIRKCPVNCGLTPTLTLMLTRWCRQQPLLRNNRPQKRFTMLVGRMALFT